MRVETVPASARPSRASRPMILAVSASCLGWAFDLFDLFILLYIAPILAKVFFPSTQPMLSLAGVYVAFTATLLMRPVGGALFGPYADRSGRKRVLVISAIGVGVATAFMGALPTVEQIGIAAPLAFVGLRLVQGLFMGGMVASTHTIGTESMLPQWRGLASGIISGGGSGLGKLFASLVFLMASWLFPGPAFAVWGWRFMFFSGLLSAGLGLLVFSKLEESPLWLQAQAPRPAAATTRRQGPLRTILRGRFLPIVAVCVMLTLAGGGLSYLTSGYLPTVLRLVNHIKPTTLGLILSLSAVCVIASSVLGGLITDLIGRRKAITIYGVLALVAIPLLYLQLGKTQDVFGVGILAVLLSGIGTFCYAPLLIILNERFPTAVRSSGTAVSWNVGFSLGGSLPVLVSLLSHSPDDLPYTLAIVTAVVSLIYLWGVWFTPATLEPMQ